jgi:hypothetical protein
VSAWQHAKNANAIPEWFVVTSMVNGKINHVGLQRRKAAVVVARCASADRIMSWAFDSWLSISGKNDEYPAGEMVAIWLLVEQKVERLFKVRFFFSSQIKSTCVTNFGKAGKVGEKS